MLDIISNTPKDFGKWPYGAFATVYSVLHLLCEHDDWKIWGLVEWCSSERVWACFEFDSERSTLCSKMPAAELLNWWVSWDCRCLYWRTIRNTFLSTWTGGIHSRGVASPFDIWISIWLDSKEKRGEYASVINSRCFGLSAYGRSIIQWSQGIYIRFTTNKRVKLGNYQWKKTGKYQNVTLKSL